MRASGPRRSCGRRAGLLVAVLAIVPAGKLDFPGLEDADLVFLRIMEAQFPTVIRGLAVAAVLAAVMSTTDAQEGLQAFVEKRKPEWSNA